MGKTKEEEIRAFNAIEDILDDFDPKETHVGKAFEGCVEQAEENIRNDRMLSYKDRYKGAQETVEARVKQIAELIKELNQKDDAIARLEDAKKEYEKEIDGLTLAKRDYEAQIEQLQNDYKALQISYEDLKAAKKQEAAAEVHALRQTILELKAKLYDMIAGEEVEE